MNPVLLSKETKVNSIEAGGSPASVSIIMPFDPKMSHGDELAQSVNDLVSTVGKTLIEHYPVNKTLVVRQRLDAITGKLDFNTHKKSIAIYISADLEKVMYLDLNVNQKVVFGKPFDIFDVLRSKKQLCKYLLLFLNEKEFRMYLGKQDVLVQIISNTFRQASSRAGKLNDTDPAYLAVLRQKEIESQNFISRTDNTLKIILEAYQLPLLVAGSREMLEQFSEMTKLKKSVLKFIEIAEGTQTPGELSAVIGPYLTDLKKLNEEYLLNLMERAEMKNKLVTGMADVHRESRLGRKHLLVMERNFIYPVLPETASGATGEATNDKITYVKSMLDDIIENVLENGGDAEFVDTGTLTKYRQIAIVKY